MSKITIAAIQMEAKAAPTADRLARAEGLVAGAVNAGAQLTVLPECFNTGYAFNEEMHARVETIDGPTVTWMRDTAACLNIYLAGSLMLLEQAETYNALLLFAPDGRMWRYDKNYPWGWERGFFRPSRQKPRITVAETSLGNIGMLICWDVAHTNLWKLYAGNIDLMLIASCPVDVGHATYHFPDGGQFGFEDMGSLVAASADSARLTFGDMFNQQAAWLGVPAAHAIEYGQIRTEIPLGRRALVFFALASPSLLKYIRQANDLEIAYDLVHECKILNGNGEILTSLAKTDGESFTIAELSITQSRAAPEAPQPASPVPRISYFLVDLFLPAIARSVYRKGQRKWKKDAIRVM